MEGSPEAAKWLGWAKALPDELVRARPVLSVWYSYALLGRAEMEEAESRLNDAEKLLGNPPAGMDVDERQSRSLLATIATGRAYLAQALGDVAGTVRYARRVLDLLPDGEQLRRDQALGLLGLACWASGDLAAAGRAFADYHAKLRTVHNIPDVIGTAYVLADIRMAQGHLREAASTLEQSLQFVVDQGEPLPPDAADLYRGLSELYLERGDLESAARHLTRSKELGGQSEQLDWQYRLCVTHARMKQVQGDMDGALALLNEAERLHIRTPLPVVRPIPAMKARVWIAQGRLAEALSWARERGLSVDGELSYLREFEHLTLARLLVARYKNDADGSLHNAMGLLERLLQAAEEGGRRGSTIEILVLLALAHEAMGDIPPALASLERAVTLAEPEGYFRIFVDEGPSMERLLTRMNASCESAAPGLKAYGDKLLAAFGTPTPSRTSPGTSPEPLVEPLSEREREVMRLLGTELKGPEIARELFISLNTLRTHTKSIFSKLGANNRRTAVRRAKDLGLL